MLGASMPNFVHILLRILAGIAGALLLYVAFFLYEDEETRRPIPNEWVPGTPLRLKK